MGATSCVFNSVLCTGVNTVPRAVKHPSRQKPRAVKHPQRPRHTAIATSAFVAQRKTQRRGSAVAAAAGLGDPGYWDGVLSLITPSVVGLYKSNSVDP
jgi:hypothetical protein